MSNNWKTYKLGEACNITSSKRIFYNEYVKSGIPFYRSKEIILKSNLSEITNQLYISQDKFNEIKNKFGVPIEGDILLTAVGTIGIPYLVKETDLFYFKDGNLTWLKDLKEILSANFFIHWIKSNIGKEALKGITIGSTQSAITIQGLKNLEIKLPRRQEQQAIASILSDIDDKIENNLAINKTLEEMAMALYKHWFVDFGPFQDGEFVESELGMIPMGWEVLRLQDISNLIAGGDKPKNYSNHKTEECGIPIYSNGISNEGLFGFTDLARINEESITVSARGTIGYVCLRTQPYLPIVRLIAVVPDKKFISCKYLFLWLLNQNISGNGTTQQQLTVPDFKGTKVLIPQFELINVFTDIVNPYYENISDNKIENQTLTQLRDTLLPKLISGEVRLKEFQEQLVQIL